MVWKDFLLQENIFVEIMFYENLKLDHSDFIFIDSKVHKDILDSNFEKVLRDFEHLKKKSKYIFYCDTGDSSCWIEKRIFPLVDKYLKCQLLKDKNLYKTKMYGKKINSDYYYRNNDIKDSQEIWSDELSDQEINKLDLSWNIFFSNHNYLSPLNYYMVKFLNQNLIFNQLFYSNPHTKRTNDFFVKFSNKNYYPTIGWQRKKILEMFKINNSNKLNKFNYFNLMKNSKYCISPFGWGEIAIRDFECFVNGCVLIKPDMSHIITWPNLFIPNLTYIPIKWDLSDLKKNMEFYKGNYPSLVNIASEAQKIYKSHTNNSNSGKNFVKRLKDIIS
tara:strand:- start:5175 stop:6170 length:996 start_codon:yes stop_codon:yes gene_type:complete